MSTREMFASSAPTSTDDVVRRADIAALAPIAGPNFRFVDGASPKDGAAFRGIFRLARLRAGLMLHATDMRETRELTTEIEVAPKLTFSVVLEGRVEAAIGGRSLDCGALRQGAGRCQPEGMAFAVAEPDLFVRHLRRGSRVRKVNVTVDPSWIAADGLSGGPDLDRVLSFSRRHMAVQRWRVSSRVAALAEQILHPPAYGPTLQNLYLESRAIEIVGEALLAVTEADAEPLPGMRPRDHQRMASVRDYLDAHLDEELTLGQIAHAVGISGNTLQRLFRGVLGTTVFDYVRARKLERAREALERQGVSVTEAAYLAGYASSANFATAFKRAFGVTPSAVRARL